MHSIAIIAFEQISSLRDCPEVERRFPSDALSPPSNHSFLIFRINCFAGILHFHLFHRVRWLVVVRVHSRRTNSIWRIDGKNAYSEATKSADSSVRERRRQAATKLPFSLSIAHYLLFVTKITPFVGIVSHVPRSIRPISPRSISRRSAPIHTRAHAFSAAKT